MGNGTFVSKPGLVSPKMDIVKAVNSGEASFLDSFNETYRDYGLEDLGSDSDNTDDENAPKKPVSVSRQPRMWALLISSRRGDSQTIVTN